MTELEIRIIKFLLSSGVYSEEAILKNLGINKNTLDNSFKKLEKNGYLESFEVFMKKEKLNEDESCHKNLKDKKKNFACKNCSSSLSCCNNNIFSELKDYSKIKVLTLKAVDEFS